MFCTLQKRTRTEIFLSSINSNTFAYDDEFKSCHIIVKAHSKVSSLPNFFQDYSSSTKFKHTQKTLSTGWVKLAAMSVSKIKKNTDRGSFDTTGNTCLYQSVILV